MSGIKRYDVEPLNPVGQSVDESADGLWVYFDDHAAEIARLRAEAISDDQWVVHPQTVEAHAQWVAVAKALGADPDCPDSVLKAALDAVALACEKEREADALRVDAERWRYARTILTIDVIEDCNRNAVRNGNFAEERESLRADQTIDAAMGADA